MNAFEQLKELIENRSDAITENMSEEDLEQINALLNRISGHADKVAETIAANLSEENKETIKKKAKDVQKNKLNDQELARRQKMNALQDQICSSGETGNPAAEKAWQSVRELLEKPDAKQK